MHGSCCSKCSQAKYAASRERIRVFFEQWKRNTRTPPNHKKIPMGYPSKRSGGIVKLVHRLRAEQALGRPLKAPETVHHADGTQNPDSVLVVCPNQAYHMLLHSRMEVVKRGGDPDTERYCRKCDQCRPFADFRVEHREGKERWICKPCQTQRNTELWVKTRGDRGHRGEKGHRWSSEEAQVASQKGVIAKKTKLG